MLRDLPAIANAAIFLGSAVIVWFAGGRLARYADGIAERTGVGDAVLGIILLGGVTSLPELAVAVTATLQGSPILTINDVLGSAAANLVILAVADLVIGRVALTSGQRSAKMMLQGVLGIILMAIAVAGYVVGDRLVLGLGVVSWLMILVYVGGVTLIATSKSDERWRAVDNGQPRRERRGDLDERPPPPLKSLVPKTVAVGLAILGTGFMLTNSADALSHQSGLGADYFGIVFLAITTSMPEVSTVIGAVRLGRYEMAISDVLGTNLVNVTIIALVDALHPGGPVMLEVGRLASVGALLSLLLTAIYLVGMIERRRLTILRMGVDSWLVVTTYVAAIILLYFLR